MKNILKSEFFNFYKSKTCTVTIIFISLTIISIIIQPIKHLTNTSGIESVGIQKFFLDDSFFSVDFYSFIFLVIPFIAIFFISSDIKSGCIQDYFVAGYSRKKIIISKILSIYLVILLYYVYSIILSLFVSYIVNGVADYDFSLFDYILRFISSVVGLLFFASLSILLSLLLENIGIIVFIYLLYSIIESVIFSYIGIVNERISEIIYAPSYFLSPEIINDFPNLISYLIYILLTLVQTVLAIKLFKIKEY